MSTEVSTKEQVAREINALNDDEIKQVADYLAFLKFRSRRSHALETDETKLAELYAEFTDEDISLAEQGMSDYAESLATEDKR